MPCFYPISIKGKFDKYGRWVSGHTVPCGACPGCLRSLRSMWAFRINKTFQKAKNGYFVTWTLNDKHIVYKPIPFETDSGIIEVPFQSVDKSQVQKALKRLRVKNENLKYFVVSEYGGQTSRPHYHGIVMNVEQEDLVTCWKDKNGIMGNIKIGTVTEASIQYVTGYMLNTEAYKNLPQESRPFRLISKGMGIEFDTSKNERNIEPEVYIEGGRKVILPRYYRSKIWDEDTCSYIGELNREKAKEALSKIKDFPSYKKSIYLKTNSKKRKL